MTMTYRGAQTPDVAPALILPVHAAALTSL
jgi:hypothetical protein